MLTSKQRAYLRKLGHDMQPLMTIGKEGLGPNTIFQLEEIFPTHELVKINILKTCDLDPKEVAQELAGATQSEVIQVVGHRMILYRHSSQLAKKGKAIQLPV